MTDFGALAARQVVQPFACRARKQIASTHWRAILLSRRASGAFDRRATSTSVTSR
jgi:hypothetical protein